MKRGILPSVLWKCPRCKGLMAASGAHAPHWVVRGGTNVLVDCSGIDVVESPPEATNHQPSHRREP